MVQSIGPLREEAKYSEHGPVLEVGDKSYALRFSGMADIKQVNQWFAMNKANSLKEWMDAMKKDQLSLLMAYLPIKKTIFTFFTMHHLQGDNKNKLERNN